MTSAAGKVDGARFSGVCAKCRMGSPGAVRRRCCRAWLRLERELVTIRIGVVGTGVMGAEHARILAAAVGGAEVSAVADLSMARAHRLRAASVRRSSVTHTV